MYLEHFGLREPPFSITPDPRFVFLSERHRDALAHLLFGIDKGGGGGFVQLTGEVGTGKTTLCRLLLEQLPGDARVALVLNPRLSPVELLETICEELHLDLAGRRGSLKLLVDALNAYLLDAYAQGLRVVLIIDEAQNLSFDALEQVRLLTNLETDTQKLLQILLLGQPELRTMLGKPELRQLAQRITARYHLTPLDAAETGAYLRHRYAVAGGLHFPFRASAVKRIHARSGGVPRLINVIAERSLLAGYARDTTRIDARLVARAADETLAPAPMRWTWPRVAAAVAVAMAIPALALWRWPGAPVAPVAAVTAKPADPRRAPAEPKAATPAIPATPRADAAALGRRIAAADGDASAWRQLLQQWNAPADVAFDCRPTVAPGLYCLRATGSLDRLVAQDRPVLLRLRDGAHEGWALLRGADAVRVRVAFDRTALDVDRLTLARFWQGDYIALWRAPEAVARVLPRQATGPAVDWVRSRLGHAGPAVMDAAMVEAVRRFQQERGLDNDGLVGPETVMALAAGDAGPRLLRGDKLAADAAPTTE